MMIIIFAVEHRHRKWKVHSIANNIQTHIHIHHTYVIVVFDVHHLACYSFKKVCHFVGMFLLLHYHRIVSITTNDVHNKEKARNGKFCCHSSVVLAVHSTTVHATAIIIKGILGSPAKTYANKLMGMRWQWRWCWWWWWCLYSFRPAHGYENK